MVQLRGSRRREWIGSGGPGEKDGLAKGFQKRGWISSVVPGGMDGLALGLQKYRMVQLRGSPENRILNFGVSGGENGLAPGFQEEKMVQLQGSRRIEWFSYRVPEGQNGSTPGFQRIGWFSSGVPEDIGLTPGERINTENQCLPDLCQRNK